MRDEGLVGLCIEFIHSTGRRQKKSDVPRKRFRMKFRRY